MTSESGVADRAAVEDRAATATFAFQPHHCFACGELNEGGLHLRLHAGPEGCRTDVALDARFSGWADLAHGGIVATILDEVMAWSVIGRGTWGVTARMTVSYHHPVPLGSGLTADGRVTEVRRRLWRTAGELRGADGTLLASAEGVYVEPPPAQLAALRARYEPLGDLR